MKSRLAQDARIFSKTGIKESESSGAIESVTFLLSDTY